MHYFIDNLETVANRLYQFLTLPANQDRIAQIIAKVKKNYDVTWGRLTRYRGDALHALQLSVGTEQFLPTLVGFFQDKDGGWKPSSANTQLVYQLVRALPDFSAEHDDEFFNPQHAGAAYYMQYFNAHHKRVSELFIEHYEHVKNNTAAPLASHDDLQAERILRRQEELDRLKKARPQGSTALLAKSLFESTIYKKKNTLPEPKKLNTNPKFAKAMNAVQAVFTDKNSMQSAMTTELTQGDDLTKSTIFNDTSALMDARIFSEKPKAPSLGLVGLFAARSEGRALPAVVQASYDRQKVG